MHRVTHFPPPAVFHLAVDSTDVSGLFADTQFAANGHDQRRPPFMSRRRWNLFRHLNFFDHVSMWWGNIVPVAASGWGALIVITPLMLTYFLVSAPGTRRAELVCPRCPFGAALPRCTPRQRDQLKAGADCTRTLSAKAYFTGNDRVA